MASRDSSARYKRGSVLVRVLSCVLTRLVSANDRIAQQSDRITKFHALRAPTISIFEYLDRIQKYSNCSAESFVLALVYIDRLIQKQNIVLCSLNVHRILITCVMMAAKFFDDEYFNNGYYARVGGVPCAEMNTLECEFLFSVNFSLHVSRSVYERYHRELCGHMFANPAGCTCDRSIASVVLEPYPGFDVPPPESLDPPAEEDAGPEDPAEEYPGGDMEVAGGGGGAPSPEEGSDVPYDAAPEAEMDDPVET